MCVITSLTVSGCYVVCKSVRGLSACTCRGFRSVDLFSIAILGFSIATLSLRPHMVVPFISLANASVAMIACKCCPRSRKKPWLTQCSSHCSSLPPDESPQAEQMHRPREMPRRRAGTGGIYPPDDNPYHRTAEPETFLSTPKTQTHLHSLVQTLLIPYTITLFFFLIHTFLVFVTTILTGLVHVVGHSLSPCICLFCCTLCFPRHAHVTPADCNTYNA